MVGRLTFVRLFVAAYTKHIRSIAFLGGDGSAAMRLCDHPLVVSHAATARIQEAHQFLLHCLMDRIENGLGFGTIE